MVEILEEPSVRRRAVRVSVETYHRMSEAGMVDRKTELVRGVIIEKRSKSPLHFSLLGILSDHFTATLPHGWHVRQEGPLSLADSEPDPDIAVVAGVRSHYLTRHPATAKLVVEINTSNEKLDREMASVYAEAGAAL